LVEGIWVMNPGNEFKDILMRLIDLECPSKSLVGAPKSIVVETMWFIILLSKYGVVTSNKGGSFTIYNVQK